MIESAFPNQREVVIISVNPTSVEEKNVKDKNVESKNEDEEVLFP